MQVNNPNIPANFQDIDNLPKEEMFSYNGEVKLRAKEPCFRHRIAFPSNNKRLYPELTNIPVTLCSVCNWFCYEGNKE